MGSLLSQLLCCCEGPQAQCSTILWLHRLNWRSFGKQISKIMGLCTFVSSTNSALIQDRFPILFSAHRLPYPGPKGQSRSCGLPSFPMWLIIGTPGNVKMQILGPTQEIHFFEIWEGTWASLLLRNFRGESRDHKSLGGDNWWALTPTRTPNALWLLSASTATSLVQATIILHLTTTRV